jgi:hypothetical protein
MINNPLLVVYKNLYGEMNEESLFKAAICDHELLLKILEIPLIDLYLKLSILEILSTIIFPEKKQLFEYYYNDSDTKIRKLCFITLLEIKQSRSFLEEMVKNENNLKLKSYMNERLY